MFAIVSRRAQILWTIEHHPDVDAAASWSLRLYTTSEDLWLPVARYYDRMAQIDVQKRKSLTESAQAIRAGRMPEWYQMLTEGEAGR
jgi:hypothetical protein